MVIAGHDRDLLMTDARLSEITTRSALQAFHARHKIELLAHDPSQARACGRFAAGARDATLPEDLAAYAHAMEKALSRPASRGRHANALQHLLGHVMDRAAAQRIAELVEVYRKGRSDLQAVKTELLTELTNESAAWAADQSYLAWVAGSSRSR